MDTKLTPTQALVYFFQHHSLRTGAKQGHPEFRMAMAAKTPQERCFHFYYFWSKAGMLIKPELMATVDPGSTTEAGFQYCSDILSEGRELDEHTLDLLTFPSPSFVGEARFVAVSQPIGHKPTYPRGESEAVRYFTLERGRMGQSVFCEWRGTSHFNYGHRAEEDMNRHVFEEMVRALLTGSGLDPLASWNLRG